MTGPTDPPTDPPADSTSKSAVAGTAIIRADQLGTAALVVGVAVGASSNRAAEVALLVIAAVLFLGGCVAFAVGFVRSAGRSRFEIVDLAGTFYLTGSAPDRVRKQLLGLWFAQIAIAVVSVIVNHPPFAVMAPVWGIGLNTLWSSRYGTFPHRPGAPRA